MGNSIFRCQYTYRVPTCHSYQSMKCNEPCVVSRNILCSEIYCRSCIDDEDVKIYIKRIIRRRREKTLKSVLYLCCLAKFKQKEYIVLTKESILIMAKYLWKTRKDKCWDGNINRQLHWYLTSN